MNIVHPKVTACFDIFPALLQTEIEEKRIALETIYRHDRFICTCLSWKYLCPGSSKYSKSRQRKSRQRKSVKSCYSTNPLIPYLVLMRSGLCVDGNVGRNGILWTVFPDTRFFEEANFQFEA